MNAQIPETIAATMTGTRRNILRYLISAFLPSRVALDLVRQRTHPVA
jgi:hypothetical protein